MSAMSATAPANANKDCVGPKNEAAGKAASCAGCPNQQACASGEGRKTDPAAEFAADKLARVKHKILVLSGKGGVGKSTVSCQLAFALASQGHTVGLLDVDICGPSVPRMLGLTGREVHQSGDGWEPILVDLNSDADGDLQVMSVGFMLPNPDDAIIWRGPRKNGLIKQFLTDVNWGELDFLIVDTPPGTSDEHLSIVQYMKGAGIDGAVVVTTPQEIAMQDVRKEINFCKKTGVECLGLVENMARYQTPVSALTFVDPDSGEDVTAATLAKIPPEVQRLLATSQVFAQFGDGPQGMAMRADACPDELLGSFPLDPNMMAACENGECFLEAYPTSAAAAPFASFVEKFQQRVKATKAASAEESNPAQAEEPT